ncbi:MAG TPA: nucleoside phosphorylase [Elusimicrobiota bacterium]|jgi:uridine phosphorylase|nr:nucleoside phosphorylase [Elusimicrobiota bacterium]
MKRQYHIDLGPGEVAPTILLCGDPERADRVAKHFDKVRLRRAHREYVTVTGTYRGVPLSVMGTGIGPDNVEIAVVELSQLVKSPTFIRLGSCGALQKDIRISDLIVTSASVRLENTSLYFVPEGYPAASHYEVQVAIAKACAGLGHPYHVGLTATAPGFYGAQGRVVPPFYPRDPGVVDRLAKIGVLNLEMEASCLLTLASAARFRAGAVCAVYAERPRGKFADAAQRKRGEARVIEAGLAAALELDRLDRAKKARRLKTWVPEAF